jgi:hypothetical protein
MQKSAPTGSSPDSSFPYSATVNIHFRILTVHSSPIILIYFDRLYKLFFFFLSFHFPEFFLSPHIFFVLGSLPLFSVALVTFSVLHSSPLSSVDFLVAFGLTVGLGFGLGADLDLGLLLVGRDVARISR